MTSPTNPYQNLPFWIRGSAKLFLRTMGWKLEGTLDGFPKCVIVAQHTSNWDGVFSISGALALDLVPNWLGKAELFAGYKGRILRRFGGIPINRNHREAVVAQIIREFNQRDTMVLFVAPEGTRKGTKYWRSGFYYIALGADVPIVQGLLDYKNKRVGLGQHLIPSGDIEADMELLRDFFSETYPKYPENAAEIRLAPPSE